MGKRSPHYTSWEESLGLIEKAFGMGPTTLAYECIMCKSNQIRLMRAIEKLAPYEIAQRVGTKESYVKRVIKGMPCLN